MNDALTFSKLRTQRVLGLAAEGVNRLIANGMLPIDERGRIPRAAVERALAELKPGATPAPPET